jgi:hypothetical protein
MRHRLRHPIIVSLAAASLELFAAPSASAADPTTSDCLTANEASISLRADHKLRDARAQLLICAAASCPADIRNACLQRVTRVNDSMPTVVFEVKDANDGELTAVAVSIDGQPLVARLEGTAISLDPGEHVFAFEVAGQPRVERRLVIHEGEKDRHERIVIGPAEPTPAPVQTPAPTMPAVTPPPPPPSPPEVATAVAPVATEPSTPPPRDSAGRSSSWNAQKTWAVVVGGVGIAGLAVGTGLGLSASSSKSKQVSECPSSDTCTQAGYTQALQDHSSATSNATWSTVGFGVGAAAIVIAVIVWATSASGSDTTPGASSAQIGPAFGSRSGALLQGAF